MEAIGPRVGLCHCPVCELYACPWCWAGAEGSCPFCAWSYAALAPVVAVAAATPAAEASAPMAAVAAVTPATTVAAATGTAAVASGQRAATAGRMALTTARTRDLRAPVAAGTIVIAIALLVLNIGASFRPTGGVGGDVAGSEIGGQASPSLVVAVGGIGSARVSATPTSARPSANPTGPVAPGGAVGPPTQPGTPAPTAKPATTPKPTPVPTPKPTPVPTPRRTASPAPTPEPTPACKTVPNLVGQTVANARSAWKAAGFTGAFTPANGQNKMIVQTQNRTPGACMPPTTTITVTVAGHV
jgi:hypothetical protein